MRKGRLITPDDVATLRQAGKTTVYVAELMDDDVHENVAASKLAQAVASSQLTFSKAATGRVNIYANDLGVIQVDSYCLLELNLLDGIALATLRTHSVVQPGEMVANLKIIPYAVPGKIVQAGITIASASPLIQFTPLQPKRVGLIVVGTSSAREKTVNGFVKALSTRLARLNGTLLPPLFVSLEEDDVEAYLSQAIHQQMSATVDLLLIAGDTAIMDQDDIVPTAVGIAGGEIIGFGVPVDPGNLLLLATIGSIPIVGVPGCARSPKANVVDLIFPRLLIGERLSRKDLVALGYGGLLSD